MSELNLPPFSINKAWSGRRFRTKEYKDWTIDALWLLKKHKKFKGKVGIDICFYQNKLADIDGGVKIFLDVLVKAGIIDDDRYVYELSIRKEDENKNKRIEFEIYKL